MRFDELKYPASMSSYLYGPNDEILTKDLELTVIKRFHREIHYAGIFYSLAPPLDTKDIGQQINTEIEDCGGEGIVSVKITSKTGFTSYLHPLTLLPFWPSYTTVVVEGDIVKYEPSAVRSARQITTIEILDDISITELLDESVTSHLSAQCRAIGTIGTLFAKNNFLFWKTNALFWKTMKSADGDESGQEINIQDQVKRMALTRGANVAEILYVTLDRDEIEHKYEMQRHQLLKPISFGMAAMDVRYWHCPVRQSQ